MRARETLIVWCVLLSCAGDREARRAELLPNAGSEVLPSPSPVAKTRTLLQPRRPAPNGVLAFRRVRLFDGDKVVEDATVVVNGDRIEAAGTGVAIPAGAAVIEGQGKTLLPGFIDAHAHVETDGHLSTGESSLEQALVVGVTTELIMAGPPAFAKQMREQPWTSPRADVFSAGHAVTAPGGHGTQFGGNVPTLAAGADGAAFATARMDEGSDFLKIIYDHWKPTISPEQIRAAAQAAAARGRASSRT